MHTHMLKCLNCGDGSGIRFFDNLCVCVFQFLLLDVTFFLFSEFYIF